MDKISQMKRDKHKQVAVKRIKILTIRLNYLKRLLAKMKKYDKVS